MKSKLLLLTLIVTTTILITSCVTLKEDRVDAKVSGNPKLVDYPIYELNLQLPDKDGNIIDVKEYTGKKLLFVNFFATWCPPCQAELPSFEAYSKKYEDDLNFVLVDLIHSEKSNKDVESVMKWYNEEGYTMPILFDLDASQTKEYLNYVQGIPTTFIYNEDGLLLTIVPGMISDENLDAIIEAYVK